MSDLPVSRVRWEKSYRLIPSRYPPIHLFERVADPEAFDLLIAIEGATNDRLREEVGDVNLIPRDKWVSGEGASYVMAVFTHPNESGSRFGDGTFGVYHAGNTEKTALCEVAYHMGRFYAATSDPAHSEDFRVLVGSMDADLHDIQEGFDQYHDPDDYAESQKLGMALRNQGSNGIAYRSVRHAGGACIAAFWPNVVGIPVQGSHFQFHWNGSEVDRFFRYRGGSGDWQAFTC